VPQSGWRLMQKHKHQEWREKPGRGLVTGSHGYDNNSPEMQAIFIGHGPVFRTGSQIPAFANIELYNLMCRILGIKAAANDGDPAWVDTVFKADAKKRQPAD
jgi:predicted AlkP superfamily pyrophosphatase or phosphodiesterase